ncbi:hypothetical protein glysoja_044042 [Glycine soja]|uniref:Uncharacterized protein n=1 Tax=Glycine soja TaxID=3848 RepID=A0A0B2SHY0_GLYSO|nr:hypothetical protein glysoja_044042 [Glycine soja]
MKSSDANSTWIAKKLTSLLVADPHINYPTMRQVLLEKYGIVPSNDMQLSWVKRKVLEKNNALEFVPKWKDESLTIMSDMQKGLS